MADQHHWRFFRAGGFDQVRLDSAEDLLNLDRLDPKLWVALSCPVADLEFDAQTLRYLDADGDGHIRVPELIAGLQWVGARLKDHAPLVAGAAALPLSAIDEQSEGGRHLAAAARRLLDNLGRGAQPALTTEDTADVQRIFGQMRFNGDGVITEATAVDEALTAAIRTIVAAVGGITDRSGAEGVDGERVVRFFVDAAAVIEWHAKGAAQRGVQGAQTLAGAEAFHAVRAKVDDYFTRCRLASFDAGAVATLNPPADAYATLAAGSVDANAAALEALPLARIEPDRPLPLTSGVNPAWAAHVAALRDHAVTPLLGARDALTPAEWQRLCREFDAYEAWSSTRPATPVADLPLAGLQRLVSSGVRDKLEALIASDLAVAPETDALAALDQLVRYTRDLAQLAHNFVAFRDFYTRKRKAIFQAGTIYFDGRSAELVIKVGDPNKHAVLADLSRLCLVYFECLRGAEKQNVVAAFTAGDGDQFIVGRNGVFYDRSGRDWRATIVKVIEQPISVRQAFWSPYKRAARMIGEQMHKFAAARAAANQAKAAEQAMLAGAKLQTPPAAPPPFDVGKFAGIFAAIGLAIGAIGTAIASMVTGLISLPAWKIPLVFLGIIALVSGPAMLLAWLRLRQRNLGPLLDANGWAVNARAFINIPFGATLTQVAVLPPGSERALTDPYAERPKRWPWYAALLLAAAAVAWWWFKFRGGAA
jgi:hypothetical protein